MRSSDKRLESEMMESTRESVGLVSLGPLYELRTAAVTTATIDLSIVMPVYNEEEALVDTLDEAIAAMARFDGRAEILLVDDASTDRTPEILAAYRQAHPDLVRVIRHDKNSGITATCQTLYANARGSYVFINGSDGQWKSAESLRMMALRDRYDLIVGRRRRKRYDWKRSAISMAFNLLPWILFGVRTYDAGSIKLFRRDILELPTTSVGPFREAERIIRAHDAGLRIGVVDVDHFARHGGIATGARWSLIRQSVVDLGRCWRELRLCPSGK
jgi:glycosyltransferase involved in cell wall biosynthesis